MFGRMVSGVKISGQSSPGLRKASSEWMPVWPARLYEIKSNIHVKVFCREISPSQSSPKGPTSLVCLAYPAPLRSVVWRVLRLP